MFSKNKVCSFEKGQTSHCLYRGYGARGHPQGHCWALVVSAGERIAGSRCDMCTCALEGECSCSRAPAFTSLVSRVTSDSRHPAVETLDV